jgi:hypothetical protein
VICVGTETNFLVFVFHIRTAVHDTYIPEGEVSDRVQPQKVVVCMMVINDIIIVDCDLH